TPFAEGVTAGLVLFYRGHEVVLGWLVALALAATGDAWDLIVGANGAAAGNVLYCRGITDSALARGNVYRTNPDAGEREWVDFPQPLDAYPPFETPESATFPGAWIDRRNTSGNNAVCYRGNKRRGLEGRLADGAVTFDPADAEGEDQCLLNAFYFCNYLHDFFYLLGFDEEEGNFQRQNLTATAGGG
ncbi:MAG: hypothetical protein GY856_21385, partial [bacterium]|nr:hypothetical protein [bacterium]